MPDFKVNNITPVLGDIKVGTKDVSKIYQDQYLFGPNLKLLDLYLI